MKNIISNTTLGIAAFLGVSNNVMAASKSVKSSAESKRMNIVMMFVDDLGWADLGLRNPHYNTPNVDRLFADGMNFERAYVTQPASSPSRASLMTGKQPVRFQLVRHIDNKVAGTTEPYSYWPENSPELNEYMPLRNWLPMEETIFPQDLKYGLTSVGMTKFMDCPILEMFQIIMLHFSVCVVLTQRKK